MMKLSSNEQRQYQIILANLTKDLAGNPGAIVTPNSLFRRLPTNARICRYLYMQVSEGKVPGVTLAGRTSRDGYRSP